MFRDVFLLVVVGLLSTLSFDAIILVESFFTGHYLDWHMLGRITAYALTKGQLIIWDWQQHAPVPYENLLGWFVHYAVGVAYALIYGFLILRQFGVRHSLQACLIMLWCLTIMPFCVLDPIAGLGFFGLLAPHPVILIALTFFNHSLYALCLWFWVNLLYV